MNIDLMVQITGVIMFFIGLFGLLTRDSIVKSILSLSILELGVIFFFLGINYELNQTPPIILNQLENPSDPLPQAMMITTIVIGVAVTTITVTLLLIVNRKYNTSSWSKLRFLRQEEDK